MAVTTRTWLFAAGLAVLAAADAGAPNQRGDR